MYTSSNILAESSPKRTSENMDPPDFGCFTDESTKLLLPVMLPLAVEAAFAEREPVSAEK